MNNHLPARSIPGAARDVLEDGQVLRACRIRQYVAECPPSAADSEAQTRNA
jgi:hypothetical protein